jgi:hypothetical protein
MQSTHLILEYIIDTNHVGPSPPSFCFLSRWNNRSHAARGKIAAATQRQKEREKLLAVVARSREPANDKAHAHHRVAPATPSSVDRASRLSHRSAEKLKQPVIASISSVFVATPIPELLSIPEHGTDEGEGHGERLLDLEVLAESEETTTIAPAEREETEDTGESTEVESNFPQLENSVCLPSMLNREAAVAFAETAVNDPDYVCVAGQLCRSVGDHTSSRSPPCVNCNQIAHHFCAEYWSEQNPVEPHLVIRIKDLSKGGELCLKNTPSAQKCNVVFCVLCESRWKAIKVGLAKGATAMGLAKRGEDDIKQNSADFVSTCLNELKYFKFIILVSTHTISFEFDVWATQSYSD